MVEAEVKDIKQEDHYGHVAFKLSVKPLRESKFGTRQPGEVTLTVIERVTVISSPAGVREPLNGIHVS